jgi:hypothetical protein
MRVAYIISAYKLPDQLIRLVRRLSTDSAGFFLHVDKKTNASIYQAMLNGVRDVPGVHFLQRHTCWWGGFGHVAATVEGLHMISRTGQSFDYVILLTGQDYPIKTNTYIDEFLHEHHETPFMEYFALPTQSWTNGGLDRIRSWHFRWKRYLRVTPDARLPLKRRVPGGLKPFGGSSYWCLPRDCIEYICRFVDSHPSYTRFFKYVDVPDELYFQTIVLNSPFRTRVVNDDLRYTRWNDPESASPAVLGMDDLANLRRSTKLFARKFDTAKDRAILDAIDRSILESERPVPYGTAGLGGYHLPGR